MAVLPDPTAAAVATVRVTTTAEAPAAATPVELTPTEADPLASGSQPTLATDKEVAEIAAKAGTRQDAPVAAEEGAMEPAAVEEAAAAGVALGTSGQDWAQNTVESSQSNSSDSGEEAFVAVLEAELNNASQRAAAEAETSAMGLDSLDVAAREAHGAELAGRRSGLEMAMQMAMQNRDWGRCQALQEELDALPTGEAMPTTEEGETPTGEALPPLGASTPVAGKAMNGRDVSRGVEEPKSAVVEFPAASEASEGTKPTWGDWRKAGVEGSAKKRPKPKVKTLFPPMQPEGMHSPTVA